MSRLQTLPKGCKVVGVWTHVQFLTVLSPKLPNLGLSCKQQRKSCGQCQSHKAVQRESEGLNLDLVVDTVAFLGGEGTEWLFKNRVGGLMRSSRKLWEFGNLGGHGRVARNSLDPFTPPRTLT